MSYIWRRPEILRTIKCVVYLMGVYAHDDFYLWTRKCENIPRLEERRIDMMRNEPLGMASDHETN